MKLFARALIPLATLIPLLVITPLPSLAHPTGAPLFTYPVVPCRILDTRVSIGPLPSKHAITVHVRGNELLASDGAKRADCGVPPRAEAVKVNLAAIQPTASSHLLVNAVGEVHDPKGVYSRLNYTTGQNISNELTVDLCNYNFLPAPHTPCGEAPRYQDFQIMNMGPSGSSVHLVADVVAYLARAPEPVE